MNIKDTEIFQKLNRETGKISWKELQPQLEDGALIIVDGQLDLVEVGYHFSADNKDIVAQWLQNNALARVSKQAINEFDAEQLFWAVVVAPWVLIQKIET